MKMVIALLVLTLAACSSYEPVDPSYAEPREIECIDGTYWSVHHVIGIRDRFKLSIQQLDAYGKPIPCGKEPAQ